MHNGSNIDFCWKRFYYRLFFRRSTRNSIYFIAVIPAQNDAKHWKIVSVTKWNEIFRSNLRGHFLGTIIDLGHFSRLNMSKVLKQLAAMEGRVAIITGGTQG